MLICYEGNGFGSEGLRRWIERIQQADAPFHLAYPTVATAIVDAREMIPVGWWFREQRRLALDGAPAELTWWVDLNGPPKMSFEPRASG